MLALNFVCNPTLHPNQVLPVAKNNTKQSHIMADGNIRHYPPKPFRSWPTGMQFP